MKKLIIIFSTNTYFMKPFIFLLIAAITFGCKNKSNSEVETTTIDASTTHNNDGNDVAKKGLTIYPIDHASMVLQWDDVTIYVDPVGGKDLYSKYSTPNVILITDIHADHLNSETLDSVAGEGTNIIAPKAVYEKLTEELRSKMEVVANGFTITNSGISIEAIPMYNLRKEALQFHPKGRGNGYVLEKNGKRIYISGDTEDIPEMRNLKDIEIAFVCMNLPYTMPMEKAAEAVLDFKPKSVYPYHFRGEDGFSDVEKFKKIVENENPDIEVILADWYSRK
jgi:L-ascorbate metabolism protein UlaG (beta-lactamase superfamily)